MYLIVGNWKMNPKSLAQALQIYKQVSKIRKSNIVQVVTCVPSVYLGAISKIKKSSVQIGVQDAFYLPTGAETGQNSIAMVSSYKPAFALVGHSEVRGRGDTDNDVNQKVLEYLRHKIKPIICVGENERDNAGAYLKLIKNQIEEAMLGVARKDLKNITIAYEPVWAIGANAKREATAEECLEVSIYIRKVLTDLFGVTNTKDVNIIYGASVNANDAMGFIQNGGVNGLLIGRDSLIVKDFTKIINTVTIYAKRK